MTTNSMCLAATLALAIAAPATAQDITPLEREKAATYLTETRTALADAVRDLSDAQWKFKPGPDRWSVAEIVEHLAVLESMFTSRISTQLLQAPPGKPGADIHVIDALILARVPDRSKKVQAPEALHPTGRWNPGEALDHFLAARRETIAFLSNPDLRGHVVDHPALGPLDAYQWLLAVAAHTERHTRQILEVKSDAHFPTN